MASHDVPRPPGKAVGTHRRRPAAPTSCAACKERVHGPRGFPRDKISEKPALIVAMLPHGRSARRACEAVMGERTRPIDIAAIMVEGLSVIVPGNAM